jgi:hypothetical protein
MHHRFAAVAVAALALAAGCTRSTDFSITQTFDPVVSAGGGVAYTYTKEVDLAKDAGSAWGHRDNVKSLDLVGADGTITAIHSGSGGASTGSIVLSRNGTDVTVGTWSETFPTAVPHSTSISLQPEGVSLVMDALKSDGKFTVKVSGSTATPVSFAADVTLHLHLTYKFP